MKNFGISQERFEEALALTLDYARGQGRQVIAKEASSYNNLTGLKEGLFKSSERYSEWQAEIDNVMKDKFSNPSAAYSNLAHFADNAVGQLGAALNHYYKDGMENSLPVFMSVPAQSGEVQTKFNKDCCEFFVKELGVAKQMKLLVARYEAEVAGLKR